MENTTISIKRWFLKIQLRGRAWRSSERMEIPRDRKTVAISGLSFSDLLWTCAGWKLGASKAIQKLDTLLPGETSHWESGQLLWKILRSRSHDAISSRCIQRAINYGSRRCVGNFCGNLTRVQNAVRRINLSIIILVPVFSNLENCVE